MYNLEEYMCLFGFVIISTHCMLTAEISANDTVSCNSENQVIRG